MKKGALSKILSGLTSSIFLCSLIIPTCVMAEEYVINPGDTISILVWGHPQYTQTITVRPDGKITYPFLGEIKVDGLTTTDLSGRIRKALLKHLIDPQVTVTVTQPKKNEVFILGQVKFPNQFRFEQSQLDLLKALSMAGGVLEEMADLQNVKIIRDDGVSEIIDLEQLLTSEPQRSVSLFPGDLVYVPGKERVSITGHVLSPGKYGTRSSLGIRQALALAGGPIQDTANLSEALLFRSTGEVVEVDLNGYLRAGDAQDELYVLNPGDALYVPGVSEIGKVNILGYVAEPGQYSVKGPITIFESLALAGGIIDAGKADLRKARIIRQNGVSEQIDLMSLGKSGSEGLSNIRKVVLYPGDTLEIHQKRELINWSQALTVVSVISLMYNMIYNTLR